MKLFMTRNGSMGFAIKKDGDIVSVFHNQSIDSNKHALIDLIPRAIEEGGVKLDAFDTVLPDAYGKFGFVPVRRETWSEAEKPSGWDKNQYKKHNNGEPDIVYMPFAYDVHTDHQIIAKALQSTLKWFRYPHIKKVYMYETPSETEFNFVENRVFRPNVFVNISLYIDDKIEVMKNYASEMGEFPFPRSEKTLRALAILRGSQSGFDSAEAFELVYERKE